MSPIKTKGTTKVLEAKIYVDIPTHIDNGWAGKKIKEAIQSLWGDEVRVLPVKPRTPR